VKAGTFNAHVAHIKFTYSFSDEVAKVAGGSGGVMIYKTFDQKEVFTAAATAGAAGGAVGGVGFGVGWGGGEDEQGL
jgi:hypothetical protein